MAKPVIACVVGTRPDTIKMAPVICELRRWDAVQTLVVSTGQHREMLAQALAAFDLAADHDLAIMQHGQTLAQVTSRALEGLDRILGEVDASFVIAQGDTTTTFCASLAAFYRQIPFGHVEAGLRTPTIHDPFPEEFNRRAAGLITDLHFPPTHWAAQNLLREGTAPAKMTVTGNTGIDAVLITGSRSASEWFPAHEGPVVLLTTHRRENWGEPQARIARAVRRLAEARPDVLIVAAMHKNPAVRETLKAELDGCPQVALIEPPDYAPFVGLVKRSTLILTDSGGVQEEAPSFGVPVLVMRETTERPEGVEAGVAKLVGTDEQLILDSALELLSNPAAYDRMARAASPYGDGKASQRIRWAVLNRLGIESTREPAWE